MNGYKVLRTSMAVLAGAFLLASLAGAQRNGNKTKAASASVYDLSKEQSVQGTIVKFVEKGDTAPTGAHALVQTASGTVDVHIGDGHLLKQKNISLAPGNTVRFVGMSQTSGTNTVFLARLVQVGSSVAAVRSTRGIPIVYTGARGMQQSSKQKAGAR